MRLQGELLLLTEKTLVHWHDWNKAALDKARKEKKPVLLAISAVWCHWCHTMDRITYNNPALAKFIDEHLVPIRVDTDRRPDINARYNLGGWPTTAILTPDGALLTGVLYAPPEHLRPLLEHVLKVFKEKQAVLPSITPLQEACMPGAITPLLDQVFAALKQSYDPQHGGFGTEPKFPQHYLLRFLLALCGHKKHGKEARKMLDVTLTNMAKGEIHDKEEGGFYRYATRQDWSQPHWEKMLDDNAQLIELYAEAARALKKPAFKKIAEESSAFMLSAFLDKKTGAFFASQDADEAYCKLSWEKRKKATPPAIDKTAYADKNGHMIAAFVAIGKRAIADKTLRFFLAQRTLRHAGATGPLWLPDHVAFLRALVLAKKDKEAMRLFTSMRSLFMDKRSGIFYDIPATKDVLGALQQRKIDFQANAELALVLLGWKKHQDAAERILRCLAGQAALLGAHAATYALAAERLRNI
jgi:hypothetical protein